MQLNLRQSISLIWLWTVKNDCKDNPHSNWPIAEVMGSYKEGILFCNSVYNNMSKLIRYDNGVNVLSSKNRWSTLPPASACCATPRLNTPEYSVLVWKRLNREYPAALFMWKGNLMGYLDHVRIQWQWHPSNYCWEFVETITTSHCYPYKYAGNLNVFDARNRVTGNNSKEIWRNGFPSYK